MILYKNILFSVLVEERIFYFIVKLLINVVDNLISTTKELNRKLLCVFCL